MTPAINQFLRTSRDTEARNFAVQAIDLMNKGATRSGEFLAKAWEANASAGRDPSDAGKMRRAALAQQAYEDRISSEKGRTMAAFALIAAREGNAAITAQQALQRAQTAQEKEVLISTVKHATRRRSVMLEAMQTASSAFKAPALDPLITRGPPGSKEVTLGLQNNWRPSNLVQRTNLFFPEDVRVAAGAAGDTSLKGLAALDTENWWTSFMAFQSEGVLSAFKEVERAMAPSLNQEPGTASLGEEAKAVMTQLQPAQVQRAQAPQASTLSRWLLPVGVAAAALYYFSK